MGKVRVKSFGDLEQDAKAKRLEEKRTAKKEAKKVERERNLFEPEPQSRRPEPAEEPNVEEVKTPDAAAEIKAESSSAKASEGQKKKTKKEKFQKDSHSQKHNDLSAKVDKSKTYPLKEALDLLSTMQRGKFDETVELHVNTTATGVSGNVTLPHGTGKKTRVAIADDKLIAEIEKGVISFDILVAEPSMMAKLAKVAKVLGPRGLMPNPKAGTITQNPQEVVKKYEGGLISFKTETKSPLLHLTVGKVSFGNEKLSENIETMINTIKRENIASITLKSTMSPGIRVKV